MNDYYGSRPSDLFSMIRKRELELLDDGADNERDLICFFITELSTRYENLGQQQLSLTLSDISRRLELGEHRREGYDQQRTANGNHR